MTDKGLMDAVQAVHMTSNMVNCSVSDNLLELAQVTSDTMQATFATIGTLLGGKEAKDNTASMIFIYFAFATILIAMIFAAMFYLLEGFKPDTRERFVDASP